MLNINPLLTNIVQGALPIAAASNLVLYLVSVKTKTNTWVDFGWGFNQFLIASYLLYQNPSAKNVVSFSLVTLWAARLCSHMLFNRCLKGENDVRYEAMAKRWPSKNVFYFTQFMLQAFLVVFPAIPLYYIFNSSMSMYSASFIVGSVISVGSIIGEHVSDKQLAAYVQDKKERGDKTKDLCRVGFWQKSRHPNLFFEVTAWTGFALMGFSSIKDILVFTGPFSLWFIVYHLTIPITEKVMRKSRPDWKELIKGTNSFAT